MNRIQIFPSLLLGFILLLLATSVALASGGIDPTAKWAWSANLGWINFNPEHGGVTVYIDHLEGYAWSENTGWIRLGTHTGGGRHAYANTSAENYGVNRLRGGQLSGYAWSANVGWINFAPVGGGVTINPHSGEFEGYAWGENVGWISFEGTSYGVITDFRESLVYLPLVLR